MNLQRLMYLTVLVNVIGWFTVFCGSENGVAENMFPAEHLAILGPLAVGSMMCGYLTVVSNDSGEAPSKWVSLGGLAGFCTSLVFYSIHTNAALKPLEGVYKHPAMSGIATMLVLAMIVMTVLWFAANLGSARKSPT